MASKQVEVSIKPIELATMQLKLNGETPFLMQRLSPDIRQQLLDMQTGKGKEKNKTRNLKKEVEDMGTDLFDRVNDIQRKMPNGSTG